MNISALANFKSRRALLLCFAVAIIEGFDLQAAGVAAPLLGPAMRLTAAQIGLFFAAATFGLIGGALVGGRIADLYGRRAGLIAALVTFGLFSVATGYARDYEALFAMRLLTGVGLGAALPNLVSIAAEAAPPQRTSHWVATMFAGMPTGGALAALLSTLGLHGGWSTIFIVGGILPIVVVPLLAFYLPELKPAPATLTDRPSESATAALFNPGRRGTTIALWSGFFCALLVLYLLLNWLPSLLVARGLGREQAGSVQIMFNGAGALSSIAVGRAMDGAYRTRITVATFAALILALVALAIVPATFTLVLAAGAVVGAALMPVQAILYGLAPSYYPPIIRGTGVGAAVAAGRLGSVAGPLLAGALIAGGRSGGVVLAGVIPIAAVAGAATIWLITRRPGAA
jgi:MFS transporter, AAHS family, 3-hydroxyphenylpropionic acid transporter